MGLSPLISAVLDLFALLLLLVVTTGIIYWWGARAFGIETPRLDRLFGWLKRKP